MALPNLEREPGQEPLPLTVVAEPSGAATAPNWTIRLPVRAERITLTKAVVVAENVTIRVHPTTESVVVGSDIRREELRLTRSGEPVVHEHAGRLGSPEGG